MLTPCEVIIKRFLPAIKASITRELFNNYDFTQEEIAERLGVTQAAISKYLSGQYTKTIKDLEKKPKIKQISKKIALSIAAGKSDKNKLISHICNSCVEFHGITCEYKEIINLLNKK
jgi:hypothetical protein